MTAEFGHELEGYLAKNGISKTQAARAADIDPTHLIRVTHSERELGPNNLILLIDAIGIPLQDQAMFLLQGMSVPKQVAQEWLSAFVKTDEELAPMVAIEEIKEHIPQGQYSKFATLLPINITNFLKIIHGHRGMGRVTALHIAQKLEIPNKKRAQFFLTEVGLEFKDIKRVLENHRNALTPEQKVIMALGYKPNSIAVKWGIDPIAQTILR
ncbi:hypothetical protein HYZ78_02515 [Candidatus Microgenomates bacterium]|nr:hypothetical protein [Candidatus Microgenomates bacterium]